MAFSYSVRERIIPKEVVDADMEQRERADTPVAKLDFVPGLQLVWPT